MANILIIEDHIDLAAGLQTNLQLDGHQVDVCHDGGKAIARVSNCHPQLIILDMMLPNKDGFSILRELRKDHYQGGIIALTARGEELDKVRALRLGADDYVTKPFGLMELLARINAVLRRSQLEPDSSHVMQFGHIQINSQARTVTRQNQPVDLTPKQFDLLLALVRQPNIAHSREQLLSKVWGHQHLVITRTIDTHIADLRRNLEQDPSQPSMIQTVHAIGYRFVPPIESPPSETEPT